MKIIDLSTSIYTNMKVYPGDPEVKIKIRHHYEKEGWELRHLMMGSHTGTHVDSFSHMHEDKKSIDQIPLDRFFGEAQVVKRSDDWPKGIGLFFTEEIGLEVLEELLEKRPNFVGGNMNEDLERALLCENIVTYTGLVNLNLIPKRKTFTFYGLPLNIKDGDGSPVRAVAMIG